MIVTNSIDSLQDWIDANRIDQSDKPYFRPIESDGVYQLPEDDFVEQGLIELGIEYKIETTIRGVQIVLVKNGENWELDK